jgi:hypothetical protein
MARFIKPDQRGGPYAASPPFPPCFVAFWRLQPGLSAAKLPENSGLPQAEGRPGGAPIRLPPGLSTFQPYWRLRFPSLQITTTPGMRGSSQTSSPWSLRSVRKRTSISLEARKVNKTSSPARRSSTSMPNCSRQWGWKAQVIPPFVFGGGRQSTVYECAGLACNRRPSARTTFNTVANFGLPSGDNAL